MEILRTSRLRLRHFVVDDAPWVLTLLNTPGWITHIGDRGVRTADQAVEWVENRLIGNYQRQGHGFWAVERLADGAVLGMCGLVHRPGLPQVDVGYALLPEFWGQGYAQEAASACLAHGHQVLRLPRILAITAPGNAASARVLAAIGMRDEGLWQMPGEPAPCRLFASGAPAPGVTAAPGDTMQAAQEVSDTATPG